LAKPDEQLPLHVLKKFRLIFGSVRRHFKQIESTCGISGSQLWVLQEVVRTPGVGVSELAGRLSIHQSTCSQLVEKLVKQKLLLKQRSSEDQRRVALVPSATGKRTLEKAPGPVEGLLPEALKGMTPAGLIQLDVALDDLIRQLNLGEDTGDADQPLSDL
jgi:DNA-binding MarR family transcriptional regulator